jgi:exodeoxyribonuclease-3
MAALSFICWNVNGIRACMNKGFLNIFKSKPDAVCIQEVKASKEDMPKELTYVPGYSLYHFPAKKRGYAGTAVYSRLKPLSVTYGIGEKKFDDEGRTITLEFDGFYLVNAYFPNSQHGLGRLKFKLEYNALILAYLKRLERRKPVVVCGDFNVAHNEIDLANPKQNMKNAGFTIQERDWFSDFLSKGFVDTFRMFETKGGHYTWWGYRFNLRARNIGWRVDYFAVSESLRKKIKSSKILKDILGSDHAPILLELDI